MSRDLFTHDFFKENGDEPIHICDRNKPEKQSLIGYIDKDYADEIIFKKDIEELIEKWEGNRDISGLADDFIGDLEYLIGQKGGDESE